MIMEVTGHETIELTDPYKTAQPSAGMTTEEIEALKKVIGQQPSIQPPTYVPPWSPVPNQVPTAPYPGPYGPYTTGPLPYRPGSAGDPQTPVIWTKLHTAIPEWLKHQSMTRDDNWQKGMSSRHEPQKWEENWH